MSAVQRRRILTAVVKVVDAHGVEATSVARIVATAGVSRKAFYELFEDRNDCVLAAIEQAVALATERVRPVWEAHDAWSERVRGGLSSLLEFFDEEPELARLCILHSGTAGSAATGRRCAVLESLAEVVDEGREAARRPPSQLTAEGLVHGAFGVIHARLLDADPGRLVDLLNPLMSFILLPYLGGGAARRELHRPLPASSGQRMRNSRADALDGLKVRLTYRTMRVLAAIAAQPGLTNSEASAGAGVTDQGQISKLLARLASLDFVENMGAGQTRGGANAWYLTALGERIERTVGRELLGAPTPRASSTPSARAL
jgi:AcrR family transcriptional regulator